MTKIYKSRMRWRPHLIGYATVYLFLFGLVFSLSASAQQGSTQVSGMVTDTTGLGIPGVSVVLAQNTKIGTVTNAEGKFLLEVSAGARLLFSSVGFISKEVPVDFKKLPMTIVLQADDASLSEVVVTAFGKKERKEAVVGSVTSINPQKLKIPSSNLTTALAGQIAGVVAYQRSGQPGMDNASFFIRGVTTFGYKQDPLILVDNIELTANDLARLQVDDIASFSILKDASATALYGARGANGVILVTTKEGAEGPARINVRFENSVSQATQSLEIADPITFMKMYNEAITTRNPLGVPQYSQNDIFNRQQTLDNAPGSNKYVYPAVNWLDELFKDRTSNQRLNGSVSGGGKIARYYIATSYNLDNGILKVSPINNFNNNVKLENYQLRSNVNINVTPTTEVVLRLSGNFDEYNGPITADGSFASDLYYKALHTSPVLFPASYPYNDALGVDTHILFGNAALGGTGTTPGFSNPYADMMKGFKSYSRSRMSAQLELNQKLDFVAKGLNFRGIFNTNRYSYFDLSRQYNPFYYNVSGYDRFTNSYSLNWINSLPGQATEYLNYQPGAKDIDTFLYLQGILDYSRDIGKNHNIAATLIGTRQQRLYANGTTLQSSLPYRNLGVSGRATYAYGQRYFLEFNFGYNGSERFAEQNRFGFFPTIGGSWIVSREKFWTESLSKVINKLKLRASYGLVGNDAIGAQRFFYLSDVDLAGGNPAYFGQNNSVTRPGVSIRNYANDEVTWETSRQTNIGLEVSLFNKLNIIAEVYKQHRYNILMGRLPIATMGLESAVSANLGTADSRGIDLSADYSKVLGRGFSMTGRANFTFSQNKYGTYEQPAYKEPWRILSGQKIGVRWGYIAERLFVDDAEAAASPSQFFGSGTAGPKGGDIKYRDMNNDGKISEADQVFLGLPSTPEIVYGAGISMSFRQFDFSAFFQGLGRTSFFIDPTQTSPFLNNRQVLQAFADSHWTEENQNMYAKYPRLGVSSTDLNNNLQTSSWWMRDGAFIRLKSLELGYTLPERVAKKMFMSNCRIYLSGLNPLTWSRFKDWDPELASNGFSYPIQKVYNIGINVNL